MELWYNEDGLLFAHSVCNEQKFVAVALGANEANKQYPADQYIEALHCIQQYENVRFILLGGPNDQQAGERIVAQMGTGISLNLAGRTTLRQAAAVLSLAKVYIGGDTGLAHMAAAAGTPVLEIHREAVTVPASILSLSLRFHPWNTPAICLRPAKALGQCADVFSSSGCIAEQPHCITQIQAPDILEAYVALSKLSVKR